MGKPEPAIFEDLDGVAQAAADAEGLADLEAGRTVSHEATKAWLKSWGTPEETPPQTGVRNKS